MSPEHPQSPDLPEQEPQSPAEEQSIPSEVLLEVTDEMATMTNSQASEEQTIQSESFLEVTEEAPVGESPQASEPQPIPVETPLEVADEIPVATPPESLEEQPIETEIFQEMFDETPVVTSASTLEEPPIEAETFQEVFDETPTVTPPRPSVTRQPEPTFAEKAQAFWEKIRPVLQAQTAKTLRITSRTLNQVAEKLETASGQAPPLDTETSETSGEFALPSFVNDFAKKARPVWEQFLVQWTKLVRWVRTRLPADWSEKLSDRALSGAIAGVLILLLWITSGIFSGKPKPTQVAVSPSPKVITPAPKVKAPSPKPSVAPPVKAPEVVKPSPTKPAEEKPVTTKPPVQVSPAPSPKPVPPPPPLKLTPEQKLIARIQDQVAEITNQYVAGLIQSVQANFRSSKLTVKVGSGWYGLSDLQQNKLADEMLGRAKQLNFSKLEITDPEGTQLARSPVVGSEMIVLKRQLGVES